MKFARFLFVFALIVAATVSVAAQEGHPLTGTWYGDFGMTAGQRNDLTVILKWDGADVTGMVNPGANAVPIKAARMDVKLGTPGQRGQRGEPGTPATPSQFFVHFEADAKSKTGGM